MIRAIILTFIILVVIYIFIFRRIRHNRQKNFDTIADYHDRYINKNSLPKYRYNNTVSENGRSASYKSRTYSTLNGDTGSVSSNVYVTRYNSNEDYREK